MTYRQAKQLLSPGDTVYIPANGRIVRAIVQSIRPDMLVTNLDNLFYDEVPGIWYLTRNGAVMALKGGK